MVVSIGSSAATFSSSSGVASSWPASWPKPPPPIAPIRPTPPPGAPIRGVAATGPPRDTSENASGSGSCHAPAVTVPGVQAPCPVAPASACPLPSVAVLPSPVRERSPGGHDHASRVVATLGIVARTRQQAAIRVAANPQLVVRSRVEHAAVVDHHDPIGERERGSAVCDEQCGAAGEQPAQRVVDVLLDRGVDRRGRVVEHEHLRIADERPCERNALALAARQGEAVLADDGAVTLGQVFDELVRLGRASGGLDLFVGGVGLAERDVRPDAVGEQEAVLEHHADLARAGCRASRRARRHRRSAPARLARRRSAAAAVRRSTCPIPTHPRARPSHPAPTSSEKSSSTGSVLV